ncbi:flagellar FliJ protein [Amorphus suaedae]
MKPRESSVRNKEFEVRELERQLAQSDMMIADFRRIADDLDRQIEAEERRTGVQDPSHFAYSTAARAARQRRDKLESSIAGLEERRAATAADLAAVNDVYQSMVSAIDAA